MVSEKSSLELTYESLFLSMVVNNEFMVALCIPGEHIWHNVFQSSLEKTQSAEGCAETSNLSGFSATIASK